MYDGKLVFNVLLFVIQVRAAAAGKVRDFCQNVDPSVQEAVIMNNVLPCVKASTVVKYFWHCISTLCFLS